MPLLDKIGDLGKSIAGIFDNGLDIYGSVKERLNAIDKIGEETVKSSNITTLPPDEADLKAKAQKALNNASLALVAAGILGVILIFMIVKRKRG